MNIYVIGTSNAVRSNAYAQQLEFLPNYKLLASCRMGDVSSSHFVVAADDIRHLNSFVGIDVILIDTFINDGLMLASRKLSEIDLTVGYEALAQSIAQAAPNVPVWFLDFCPPPLDQTGKSAWIQSLRGAIFSNASIRSGYTIIENDAEHLWFVHPDILHYRVELTSVLIERLFGDISNVVSDLAKPASQSAIGASYSLLPAPPWSSGLIYNTLTTSTFHRINKNDQIATDSTAPLGVLFISTNNPSDYLVAECDERKLAFPASTIYGRKLVRYLQFPDWFRQNATNGVKLKVLPFAELDSSFTQQSMPNSPAIHSDNNTIGTEVEVIGIVTAKGSSTSPYFETASTSRPEATTVVKPASVIKRIYFDSFWAGFNPKTDPIFGDLLGEIADIQYATEPDDADLIVCSWASGPEKPADRHRQLKRKYGRSMLYYTAEHNGAGLPGEKQIDFTIYDFAFSHYRIDNTRHAWMPNYVRRYGINVFSKVNELYSQNIKQPKTLNFQFCYSNSDCDRRNKAFHTMNNLLPVDCGGKLFNNSGVYLPRDQNSYLQALAKYRFIFAYENACYPSYHTEKLINALMAGSIPLYWGDALVRQVWNRDCFIDLNLAPEMQIFHQIARDPEKYFSEHIDVSAIPCPNARVLQSALYKQYTQAFRTLLDL